MNAHPKSILQNLLEAAIAGTLTFQDLRERWPAQFENCEPYNTIFEDLEDAVTHIPGFLFKSGIDHKVWSAQMERHVLICDLLLVPFIDGDIDSWLSTRIDVIHSLKKLKVINEASVQSLVDECLRTRKKNDAA